MPKRVDLAELARAAFARVDHEAEAAAFYAVDKEDCEVLPLRLSHLNETGEAVLVFRHLAGTRWLQTPHVFPCRRLAREVKDHLARGEAPPKAYVEALGTFARCRRFPLASPPSGVL